LLLLFIGLLAWWTWCVAKEIKDGSVIQVAILVVATLWMLVCFATILFMGL
jgi:hypothetical protein